MPVCDSMCMSKCVGMRGVNMDWCGCGRVCEHMCWCAVVGERVSVCCPCECGCVRVYGHIQVVRVGVLVFGSGSE